MIRCADADITAASCGLAGELLEELLRQRQISGELAHKATSRQGQCRRYFGKVAVAVSSAVALIAGASSGRMNPSATPWSSAACHWVRYAAWLG